MTDSTVDTSTDSNETVEVETEEFEGGFDEAKARAAIKKKNSEAKGLRERMKALQADADKWTAAQEAAKTEEQRRIEQHELTLAASAKVESDFNRFKAATLAGFQGDQLEDITKRLVGDSLEELTTDAKTLFESFGAKPGARSVTLDTSQGRTSTKKENPLLDTLSAQLGIQF